MDYFLKIFSTKILRDILYYHAKFQSISTIRTEVAVSFLFFELRQSRTLIFDVLHFCSSLAIAAPESLKSKAPQAIEDITPTSKARNLSFSLLQLGLATLTSTAGQGQGQGQRLGPVVMVKFYLNLLAVLSQKQSFSHLQVSQVFRYIPSIDLGEKGENKSNTFNIFPKKPLNSKVPIILCPGLSESHFVKKIRK